ncbi:hypothetical protein ABPG77_001317 [Micractinium sp. CCAP 211/92]
MASAAVTARPREAVQLNPGALEFISSRSGSESGSPVRCSSPVSSAQGVSPRAMQVEGQAIAEHTLDASGSVRRAGGGGSGGVGDVIPAPAPRLSRRSSSNSLHSGAASPPLPVPVMHPGMMPAYGWAGPPAYPMYHAHPHPAVFHGAPSAPPAHDGPVERAASPPAVFPNGGSPPLPTGFISVPLQGVSNPGSPTSRHMYGASPPHHHSPFGASPPYGSSPPPGMAGSPPGMGMMYMPPPMLHHAHSGEYMPHAGFTMQQQEFAQRMAGLSLSHGQPAAAAAQQQQQQQQQAPRGPGSSSGRSEGRASARIARSHRAGGAYNPAEFEFDLAEAESRRPDARRTLMIRNIPNKYTQEMMLSVLQKSGFGGTFDFFYLPIDFRNKCNLGYCFVNFLDAAVAGRLYRDFHQKRWEEYNSKKVCEVTYGRVQGREALVSHFRASKFPSDDIEFMPLVFTRVEAGLAARPVPIHQYLGALDSGALHADESDSAEQGADGGAVADEAAGEAPAGRA